MDKKLNIAFIQTSLVWENPEANRNHFSKKVDSISKDTDLIILPEMFTTGFTMSPQNMNPSEGRKTLDWMQMEARNRKTALIGSIVFLEDGVYTNRLLFVEPDGKFSKYDKRHTFTLAGEDRVYSSGTKKLIVNYKGFSICPMICYDLRFPVWARNTEDYDVLIFVANWPKPRIMAWDVLLRARAIENMAYCVGVNRIGTDDNGHEYSGHSAVYDCLGEQIVFSGQDEIVYSSLSKEHITFARNKLKFLEDADDFKLF